MAAKILFFSGSTRTGSYNSALAKEAYQIALDQGAEATYADLKEYPMPIYDGDLESDQGLPEKAIAFKQLFSEHQGVFIASPEYNSSFSPLLKNTLDWISRPHEENEEGLSAYKGKVIAIAAASPGGFGGLRGLIPLRMMLGNISTLVLPEQLAISGAHKAFNEQGHLVDEKFKSVLSNQVQRLIEVTKAQS